MGDALRSQWAFSMTIRHSWWQKNKYNSLQDKPTWTSQAWVVFVFYFSLPPIFRCCGSKQFPARYLRSLTFLGTSTPSSQSKSTLNETAVERTGVRSCSYLNLLARKSPAKRSQLFSATHRNIIGYSCARLVTLLHHVGYLTIFNFEPATFLVLQHVATGWPNACNMLRPTIQVWAYKCWANIVAICCVEMVRSFCGGYYWNIFWVLNGFS